MMIILTKLKNKYINFNIIKTFNGEAVVLNENNAKGILVRGVDKRYW